ncbi:MAG: DedA family protein [Glaciimonas sp.]|nr:DedA family protein [Glaciimonas sp.]
MFESATLWLLAALAIPAVGLPAVFFISLIAATLIPMGSEPVVFAVIKGNAAMFWPAIFVATIGNTLGCVVNYGMGYGAKQVFASERRSRWFPWLEKFGAKSMLFAWLPVIGDPMCSVAGWLKFPFWPCVMYMAIGKLLRYVAMTWLLLEVPDGFWHQLGQWLA